MKQSSSKPLSIVRDVKIKADHQSAPDFTIGSVDSVESIPLRTRKRSSRFQRIFDRAQELSKGQCFPVTFLTPIEATNFCAAARYKNFSVRKRGCIVYVLSDEEEE